MRNEKLAVNNEKREKNKERRELLTFLFVIFYLLFIPFSLFTVDVGLVIDQKVESGDDTRYTGIVIPRITGLVGDKGDFYVSAGFTYQNEPSEFAPELLRTDFNWHSGGVGFTVGRMAYDDPLGYVASGLFDGARVTFDTDVGSFSAGAWYTGLLYKKRVNIEMTENEYMANNTELDYGDFMNGYFAPRRALAAIDWEHDGLWEKAIARLSLLGQFDLTDEKVNSQYLAGKIIAPYGAFSFDLGGCFELIEANDKTGSAFAVEASAAWRNPVHYVSLGAKYASGESDTLSAFLPLTTNTQGNILEPKLLGLKKISLLTMISLDYTARLSETFSVGFYPAYFIFTDTLSGDGQMRGGEIYAALYWSPLPDIGVILGGGAYLPSIGNAAPDEKTYWCVKLNVVLSLF
jgi:hypothetical protein